MPGLADTEPGTCEGIGRSERERARRKTKAEWLTRSQTKDGVL